MCGEKKVGSDAFFVLAGLWMLCRLPFFFFFQPRLGESSQDRGSRIFLGFTKLRKEGRHRFYLSCLVLVGLCGHPAKSLL